jgi:hypothetical protein
MLIKIVIFSAIKYGDINRNVHAEETMNQKLLTEQITSRRRQWISQPLQYCVSNTPYREGRSTTILHTRSGSKEFIIKMEGNTGEFSDISGSEIH